MYYVPGAALSGFLLSLYGYRRSLRRRTTDVSSATVRMARTNSNGGGFGILRRMFLFYLCSSGTDGRERVARSRISTRGTIKRLWNENRGNTRSRSYNNTNSERGTTITDSFWRLEIYGGSGRRNERTGWCWSRGVRIAVAHFKP